MSCQLLLDQLGFMVAQEVCHQVLASMPRARGRFWNCATDCAINRMIDRIKVPGLPGRSLYGLPDGEYRGLGQVRVFPDRRFDGMVAEVICDVWLAEELDGKPLVIKLELGFVGDRDASREVGFSGVENHGGGVDVHLPDVGWTDRVMEELESKPVISLPSPPLDSAAGRLGVFSYKADWDIRAAV